MSTALTNAQTRFLRGQAHGLKAMLQVGGKGISDALVAEVDGALEHHELIKVKVAAEDREARDAMVEELANRAGAALEQAARRMADDLAGSGWLAGSGYTLAYIALYPHAVQFGALDIAVPEPVHDWLDRVAERPAVSQVAGEMPLLATMGPEPGRWG